MHEATIRDRRTGPVEDSQAPEALLRTNAEVTRAQLLTARESLIAARRRVASLEAAAENWAEMTHMLEDASVSSAP